MHCHFCDFICWWQVWACMQLFVVPMLCVLSAVCLTVYRLLLQMVFCYSWDSLTIVCSVRWHMFVAHVEAEHMLWMSYTRQWCGSQILSWSDEVDMWANNHKQRTLNLPIFWFENNMWITNIYLLIGFLWPPNPLKVWHCK